MAFRFWTAVAESQGSDRFEAGTAGGSGVGATVVVVAATVEVEEFEADPVVVTTGAVVGAEEVVSPPQPCNTMLMGAAKATHNILFDIILNRTIWSQKVQQQLGPHR